MYKQFRFSVSFISSFGSNQIKVGELSSVSESTGVL